MNRLYIVDVMTIGNMLPRAGIEPTSLAIRDGVIAIIPLRIPDVTSVPIPTCIFGSLPQSSVQTTTPVPLEL